MTSPCTRHEETLELFGSGQRSALEPHLNECPACRDTVRKLEAIGASLALEPSTAPVPGFVEQVVARLDARPAPPSLAWRLAAAAALIVLGVFGAVRWRSEDDGFGPRGGPGGPERWAAVRPYVGTPEGFVPVERELQNASPLAFEYTNRGSTPFSHLMIFAVDSAWQVAWYYPEWVDPTADPRSTPIDRALEPRRLPHEITHFFADGPIRLFAVFSFHPLSVSEVERAVQAAKAQSPSLEALHRLALPHGTQQVIPLVVTPSLPVEPAP